MLLYEKDNKLNLSFANDVKEVPDVVVEKVFPTVYVKLNGVAVFSGSNILIDIESRGRSISSDGTINATLTKENGKGTLELIVSCDDRINLQYAFGSNAKADVPADGIITNEYTESTEDTLVITATVDGKSFSETFNVSVTLV